MKESTELLLDLASRFGFATFIGKTIYHHFFEKNAHWTGTPDVNIVEISVQDADGTLRKYDMGHSSPIGIEE